MGRYSHTALQEGDYVFVPTARGSFFTVERVTRAGDGERVSRRPQSWDASVFDAARDASLRRVNYSIVVEEGLTGQLLQVGHLIDGRYQGVREGLRLRPNRLPPPPPRRTYGLSDRRHAPPGRESARDFTRRAIREREREEEFDPARRYPRETKSHHFSVNRPRRRRR